jgi:hypothetical protein
MLAACSAPTSSIFCKSKIITSIRPMSMPPSRAFSITWPRPWLRGSNGNTNGLLREYLPKGTDLSGYTQDDINAIAGKLNNRPRKIHRFRTLLQVYNDMLQMAQISDVVLH